ncbi:MAG: pyridoxal phosphate-dependent aminotransferase [Pseudomonadota bacterium]
MTAPLTPLAAALPATVPFVGPEQQERDRGSPFRARIGANESPFGPSPRAIAAIREAAAESWQYADPTCHDLKTALADRLGLAPDCLVIGEGIDGLLGLTVRLFAGPGDVVVTSAGAYPTFNYHVAGFGARLVTAPYRDDAEDPEALAAAAMEECARLVYLSNPDNPMGSWLTADRLAALLDALPPGCLLCLDEAYGEFAPTDAILPLDPTDRRLIRFRTFSKAYGLAGLRIGYAIAPPEVAAAYDRVRNHFGVNRLAQAAGIAALADQPHLAQVLADTAAARREIERIARTNGLTPLPSATNFVAVDCGADGARARAVLQGLLARDVFVRMPGIAPLDRCIRIGAGTPANLRLLAEALPGALAATQAETAIDTPHAT